MPALNMKLFNIIISILFSGGANAYSVTNIIDPFDFIPSLAIQDAAISAAMKSVTGNNIYEAYAKGIIKAPRGRVSSHLCNGKDETLKEALIGGCSLVEDISISIIDTEYYIKRGNKLIKVDVKNSKNFISEPTTQKYITRENPLIKNNKCHASSMYGTPTSCFVYKIAPFVFDNISYRQNIIKALEKPCHSLTSSADVRRFSGYNDPQIAFLAKNTGTSRHILDCEKKIPETFSTIIDNNTQSILVIRNKK